MNDALASRLTTQRERLFKRRFEGHFDFTCCRLCKSLGEARCLLRESLDSSSHELGLYAKHVLKVLSLAQLLYELLGSGDVFLGEAF